MTVRLVNIVDDKCLAYSGVGWDVNCSCGLTGIVPDDTMSFDATVNDMSMSYEKLNSELGHGKRHKRTAVLEFFPGARRDNAATRGRILGIVVRYRLVVEQFDEHRLVDIVGNRIVAVIFLELFRPSVAGNPVKVSTRRSLATFSQRRPQIRKIRTFFLSISFGLPLQRFPRASTAVHFLLTMISKNLVNTNECRKGRSRVKTIPCSGVLRRSSLHGTWEVALQPLIKLGYNSHNTFNSRLCVIPSFMYIYRFPLG